MSTTFPYLEIKGDYTDIGNAIGETFRQRIKLHIGNRKQIIPDYLGYLQKLQPYIQATKRVFPQYIEEMGATARAVGVTFEDLLFTNTGALYNKDIKMDDGRPQEHCTTVVARSQGDLIIGHNEDWAPEAIDDLFVLKATIGEHTMLGLNYAPYLIGVSASVTSRGIAQCINSLEGEKAIGIPVNFASRAVLEADTLREADRLLRQNSWTSGYNHVLVQDDQIRNIEVASSRVTDKQAKDVPFVHTNHYLDPEMRKYEIAISQSSIARFERARELSNKTMTVRDVDRLLSDAGNPLFPICRPRETLASVIILPDKGSMYVKRRGSSETNYQKYSL